MSIIQEALKKAQVYVKDGRNGRNTRPIRDGIPEKPAPQKRPGASSKKITLSLAITVSSLLVIVSAVILNRAFTAKDHLSAAKSSGPSVPLNKPSRQEEKAVGVEDERLDIVLPGYDSGQVQGGNSSLESQSQTMPKFLLNGIMYLETGPQAIINGAVVKEGDIIDGAVVARIDRSSVTLRLKDSEIILRVI